MGSMAVKVISINNILSYLIRYSILLGALSFSVSCLIANTKYWLMRLVVTESGYRAANELGLDGFIYVLLYTYFISIVCICVYTVALIMSRREMPVLWFEILLLFVSVLMVFYPTIIQGELVDWLID